MCENILNAPTPGFILLNLLSKIWCQPLYEAEMILNVGEAALMK